MTALEEFKGKNVAVFGLGKAGRSAVEFLLKRECLVYAWDDNEEACKEFAKESIGKNITLAPPDTYMWGGIEILVLSPGVPLKHPEPHPIVEMAREVEAAIISDVELLHMFAPDSKYVGITGTNGKSTTTALTGHIVKEAGLKAQVGGNIGVPASSLEILDKDGIYILELSSYQLDLIHKMKFNIAALLNITPDHIDRHGSMEGYIEAKKKIFLGQKTGDCAVVAVDDVHTRKIFEAIEPRNAKAIAVSGGRELKKGIYVEEGFIFDNTGEKPEKVEIGKIKTLPGKHNQQNIAVAYGIARELEIKPTKIAEAIKTFPGLEHRIQYVAEKGNMIFINDSKATNADAASKALDSFEDIYWIAGGIEKEGGISSLEKFFPKIIAAFLIGEAQDKFSSTLEGKVEYKKCDTLENAFKEAIKKAEENGGKAVIMLSPACASFDQFKNFEERGDAFCNLVGGVLEEESAAG